MEGLQAWELPPDLITFMDGFQSVATFLTEIAKSQCSDSGILVIVASSSVFSMSCYIFCSLLRCRTNSMKCGMR
jgi:hypothetical protein